MNCFLFDIDGTVADTVPQMAISIKNSFSSLGRDYPPESEVRGYVGNDLDKLVLRSMKRSFDADYSDFSEEEFVKFKKAYSDEYMRQITANYKLFPGVAETVRKLKELGKKLGIVTNKPQPYIEPFLRSAGIFECFDFTLGGGVIKEKKPSPAPILYAMEKLGAKPGETVMVGDSSNDILAAKAAGVSSVGLTYGYNYGHDIGEFGPDLVTGNFSDVLKFA